MAGQDDPDIPALRERLTDALRLQCRSPLLFTLVAATLTGVEAQSVAGRLTGYAAAELEDTTKLVEKAYSLGCVPELEVPNVRADHDVRAGLQRLLDSEVEIIAALHAVIPETGQQPWSEALEHLLEHLIMRKQWQVDFLRRVLGKPADTVE
jgi:bacterioferritin (cytochrome b1)